MSNLDQSVSLVSNASPTYPFDKISSIIVLFLSAFAGRGFSVSRFRRQRFARRAVMKIGLFKPVIV